jgi:CDP-diacylglycerol--glycerol-3-phosphate 3-phosphatidyltransferase
MNIPNTITLIRIALVPVFILAYALGWGESFDLPFWIFTVASLTDVLDGYIARRKGLVTTFGKFIDPLADKLLISAALIILIDSGLISAWIVIVILARDFVVTSLRLVAVDSGEVIAAKTSGKIKMLVQVVVISFMLGSVSFFDPIIPYLVYLMLAVTVWSGVDYVWRSRHVFGGQK